MVGTFICGIPPPPISSLERPGKRGNIRRDILMCEYINNLKLQKGAERHLFGDLS